MPLMVRGQEVKIDITADGSQAEGEFSKVAASEKALEEQDQATGASTKALGGSAIEAYAGFGLLSQGIGIVENALSKGVEVWNDWADTQALAAETDAKLNVILTNQAGAVGANAEQFRTWARAMSEASGVSVLTLENAMAMAASFGDLSGRQIPETTQAALDMSAVLGGDVSSNLTMIAGILETGTVPRSLKFSDALKENVKDAIEAGNKDAALGLILAELEKRYGGAAAAIDDAGTHADDVANAYENLKAASGDVLAGQAAYNEMLANGINAEADQVRMQQEQADIAAELGINTNSMVWSGNHLITTTRELTDAEQGQIGAMQTQNAIYAAYAQAAAEAANAQEKLALDTRDYKAELTDLDTIVSGQVGKAYDNYIKKIDDLNERLAKAKKPEDREKIKEQIEEETAAYDRQTREIQYNTVAKIINADKFLSDKQKQEALDQISDALGLQDAKTKALVDDTRHLQNLFGDGGGKGKGWAAVLGEVTRMQQENIHVIGGADSAIADNNARVAASGTLAKIAATQMNGSITPAYAALRQQANEASIELGDDIKHMRELDGMNVTATVNILVNGSVPTIHFGGQTNPGATPRTPMAGGGSFVVPEAYGYEGFDLGGLASASAGERVTVTPRGAQSKQAATVHQNFYGTVIMGPDAQPQRTGALEELRRA